MVRWKEIAGKPAVRDDAGPTHPDPRARAFKDLEIVRLVRDFESPDGLISKGTTGTVLQVFDHGTAYQVEFEGPHEIPETVPADALEPPNESA